MGRTIARLPDNEGRPNNQNEKFVSGVELNNEGEKQREDILQALPSMASVGIFLGSLTAALLAIARPSAIASPGSSTANSEAAISTCWLVSLILSILSCASTMSLYKSMIVARHEKRSSGGYTKAVIFTSSYYLLIISIVLLLVGLSIWVWIDFPRVVAVSSTALGVGLCVVTVICSSCFAPFKERWYE